MTTGCPGPRLWNRPVGGGFRPETDKKKPEPHPSVTAPVRGCLPRTSLEAPDQPPSDAPSSAATTPSRYGHASMVRSRHPRTKKGRMPTAPSHTPLVYSKNADCQIGRPKISRNFIPQGHPDWHAVWTSPRAPGNIRVGFPCIGRAAFPALPAAPRVPRDPLLGPGALGRLGRFRAAKRPQGHHPQAHHR